MRASDLEAKLTLVEKTDVTENMRKSDPTWMDGPRDGVEVTLRILYPFRVNTHLNTCFSLIKQMLISLGGHLKTGQWWTGQNRPTDQPLGTNLREFFYAPAAWLSREKIVRYLSNMEIISFRGWKLRADSYQTGLAYQTIVGTTQSCECQWCANFVAAREDVYPPEMLAGLTDLGVDHTKEADLYQQAIDTEHETILYRWWFYCIGHIEEGSQSWEYMEHKPDEVLPMTYWDKHLETLRESPRYFGVGFSDSSRRRTSEEQFVPNELKAYSLVQVEFNAEVPWVLNIPLPKEL